jgi:deoxyribodipyrimidine photolyase-related protein
MHSKVVKHNNAKTLRLILGDQLNSNHSWFSTKDDSIVYIMMETQSETSYVKHHIQKITAFFSAMRNFSNECSNIGHNLHYITLDDRDNKQGIAANCEHFITSNNVLHFEYQQPDEWRLQEELRLFCERISITSTMYSTEHFLSDKEDWITVFKGKKTVPMESFYRYMRKKYSILMDGTSPVGGTWNYDHENRKSLPNQDILIPPLEFQHNVSDLVLMLASMGIETIGKINKESLPWPISRKESLELLSYFTTHLLKHFGTYQDAMTEKSIFLFHSRLSFSLNTKLLHPLEVIQAAIDAWKASEESISLSQVEGFIRQILGWREYIRGIYREYMPDYSSLNFFNHQNTLPEWFWTGKTDMNCMSKAINQSLEYAYAHHIQRLMIIGNFALLAGIHPDEVDAWYLGIYIDAIEWVELPNTRGMSQFADGGIVGTKPYISSSSYIHSMSDYCKNCVFDRKKKYGENACPFNSLYWQFYHRNREQLKGNPRVSLMYKVFDSMSSEEKEQILLHQPKY